MLAQKEQRQVDKILCQFREMGAEALISILNGVTDELYGWRDDIPIDVIEFVTAYYMGRRGEKSHDI